MSGRQTALDRYIEEQGGEIRYDSEGKKVSFPETEASMQADAKQIEAAVQRAQEFGTTAVRLWRDRGEGWYAATSHEEHPGFSYVCQIDERTGQPMRCECDAIVVCHHLGRAVMDWRERVGWYANDAKVAELVEEFGHPDTRVERMQQEVW